MGGVRYSQLVAGLRVWIAGHDPHVRAAVDLLIDHGVWLRRPEFVGPCVGSSGGESWIDWASARELFDAGVFAAASSTERAVLEFAIALGEDRYRFTALDRANRRLVQTAIAEALCGGVS